MADAFPERGIDLSFAETDIYSENNVLNNFL